MRVISGPAEGFGLLFVLVVVFVAGYGMSFLILEQLMDRKNRNPTVYRDTLKPVVPDYLTEGNKNMIALVGGGIAVVLVIILLLKAPMEWRTMIWNGLTVIGILVSIATFIFFFANESDSKAGTNHKLTDAQTRRETKREVPKHQAEHQNRVYEAQREQQELKRESNKHQTEYQARVYELQRKQAEIQALKDDLYSLFGISENQGQKREKLLAEVLNRFFKINGIFVTETFEVVASEREGFLEHVDGVIEFDGYLYLVEMNWRKEPLGKQEVSPHLVRVFNGDYPGGIMITNSEFTQLAITTCKEALSQKIVVLCELEELVILLERNGSLKDFLKAKITAALVDKNPLFKPL